MDDRSTHLIENLTGLLNRGETAEEALELAAEILLEVPADLLRQVLIDRARYARPAAAVSGFLRRLARDRDHVDGDPPQVRLVEAIGSQAGTLLSVKISEALHHKAARRRE